MKRVKASEGVIFYRVLPKSMGIEAPGDEIELGLPFAEAIILIDKMLDDLHLFRTALDEYEYRGTSALRDAISGYLGSVAMAREQIVTHTTEPQKTSLANVLTAANSVFLLAHNTAVAWPHIQAGITIALDG